MSSRAQLKKRLIVKSKKSAIRKASKTATSSKEHTTSSSVDTQSHGLDPSPTVAPPEPIGVASDSALRAFQRAEFAMGAKEVQIAEALLKLQTMAQQLSTSSNGPMAEDDALTQWREHATAMLTAADVLDDLHHDICELREVMLEQADILKTGNH